MSSCVEVDNGFRGVVYYPYGNGLDKEHVLNEGVDAGFSWLWNDLIVYEIRQKTLNYRADNLLDKEGLKVTVSASVFHKVQPSKIGYLHIERGEDYAEGYILPMFAGIVKDVVAKYGALELNSSGRQAAQAEIEELMRKEMEKNYLICDNVIIKEIGIPEPISNAITAKKTQDEKNILAEKKKLEATNLAAAKIEEAKGDKESRILRAEGEAEEIRIKQRALSQSPRYVELVYAEKWSGSFGNNNVFGKGVPVIKMPNVGGK